MKHVPWQRSIIFTPGSIITHYTKSSVMNCTRDTETEDPNTVLIAQSKVIVNETGFRSEHKQSVQTNIQTQGERQEREMQDTGRNPATRKQGKQTYKTSQKVTEETSLYREANKGWS